VTGASPGTTGTQKHYASIQFFVHFVTEHCEYLKKDFLEYFAIIHQTLDIVSQELFTTSPPFHKILQKTITGRNDNLLVFTEK